MKLQSSKELADLLTKILSGGTLSTTTRPMSFTFLTVTLYFLSKKVSLPISMSSLVSTSMTLTSGSANND